MDLYRYDNPVYNLVLVSQCLQVPRILESYLSTRLTNCICKNNPIVQYIGVVIHLLDERITNPNHFVGKLS